MPLESTTAPDMVEWRFSGPEAKLDSLLFMIMVMLLSIFEKRFLGELFPQTPFVLRMLSKYRRYFIAYSHGTNKVY